MITTYTEQLERYEALSIWCALFTVICILDVILFTGYLIVKGRDGQIVDREGYHFVLTCLFLSIPFITTLYLYIFAMNMRKVALFRGYLIFLENQWNVLAGSEGAVSGSFLCFWVLDGDTFRGQAPNTCGEKGAKAVDMCSWDCVPFIQRHVLLFWPQMMPL